MQKSYSARMSKSQRALYAVKKRKEDYSIKRFNNPLRVFIERKYPEAFEEFSKLYNFIDYTNPGKKDLMKTLTFKEWLKNNSAPIKNTTPPKSSSETESANLNETVSLYCDEMLAASPNEMVIARPNERNVLLEIIDEVFGPDGIPEENLNEENDEGIELNYFDELAFNIEPFDFLADTEEF